MKKIICIISFMCFIFTGFAQDNEDYSQYEVRYNPVSRIYLEVGV